MHNIEYLSFNGILSQDKITEGCNTYVSERSDSGSGLYEKINFNTSRIYNSYEEAHNALSQLSTGNYDQYAVQYKPISLSPSKGLQTKMERLQELQTRYNEMNNKQHYTPDTVKSEFIGCKFCGSRLAVEYLKSNNCAMCGKDLRPKTITNKIDTLAANIKTLQKQIDEMTAKETAKAAKHAPTQWLVRIEYHS